VPETDNIAPAANAGPDQSVVIVEPATTADITLDGTDSTDSDGTIASYSWIDAGEVIANTSNPTVTLSVGFHTITLTVTDDDGGVGVDSVLVTIGNSFSSRKVYGGSIRWR
jgi:hypothetical protein